MSFRQRLSSKWASVLLIVAAVWLGSEAAGVWLRVRRAEQELTRLQDRADDIERDIHRQQELLAKAEDPEWLRYQARLRLNYKDVGEHAVIVYKKENSGIIAPAASAREEGDRQSLLHRAWDWFAGIVQW